MCNLWEKIPLETAAKKSQNSQPSLNSLTLPTLSGIFARTMDQNFFKPSMMTTTTTTTPRNRGALELGQSRL